MLLINVFSSGLIDLLKPFMRCMYVHAALTNLSIHAEAFVSLKTPSVLLIP
jgi:hypothetical protein